MNFKDKSAEFSYLKKLISHEKQIIKELNSLFLNLNKTNTPEEKKLIINQINTLKNSLRQHNSLLPKILARINLIQKLPSFKQDYNKNRLIKTRKILRKPILKENKKRDFKKVQTRREIQTKKIKYEFTELEKTTLKMLKKKQKKEKTTKEKKPSKYVKFSSKLFYNISSDLQKEKMFKALERELIKAKLQFVPLNYISVMLFTTLLSFIVGTFIMTFFLFFNLGPNLPIITFVEESLGSRLLKIFWIPLVAPIVTFLFMYFYPSLEKKSSASKIDVELPFVTIHMAAISNSLVEPSQIFKIIISTGEYPNVSKEFIRLLNEVNIHGYNLVSALRDVALNCPSKDLSELLNGLATTITSGGDLPGFFDKRSETLLFKHRIQREKSTRASETFMDIYISVVIAAPMILMLLLVMMKISGLGISLSLSMISLIMILGVAMINVLFLTFLHLRQPNT